MSFPSYLDKIINSQLKNKEIQTVRSEITKLISGRKQKKDDKNIDEQQISSKRPNFQKTMQQFFQAHSIYKQHQNKYQPRKTFSEMHINRLKKRLTIQQQLKSNKEIGQPQQLNMNQWRNEMLKHLKAPLVMKPIELKQQIIKINQVQQNSINNLNKQKGKLKLIRQTASNPSLKRNLHRQKINIFTNNDSNISSQKRIILIRPQPVSEEEVSERAIPKLKKPIKQKKVFKKPDFLQQDQFTVQRIANFTALLPYLGTQKAKVEARQQRKLRPVAQQLVVTQKISIKSPPKKTKKVRQQIIEITGWQIQQQS